MKYFCRATRAVMPGLVLLSCFTGCSSTYHGVDKKARDNGFVHYWGAPTGNGSLKLAVKDLIDMKGYVTGAGSEYVSKHNPPATQDAPLLAIARERNVPIVGKTNLTEFAVTVSGENNYFGTPKNRANGKHDYIPGGSSSGSAVAVATGMADVAFGTDTGGSIRVPAACCGVFGLKTTFGLVPTKGVFPISAEHLDTVGPLARTIPHLVEGMDWLQRGFRGKYNAAVAAKPSARQIKIGRLYLNGTDPAIEKAIDATLAARGFQIVYLNEDFKKRWKQADEDGETIALGDAYQNDQKYAGKSGVRGVTKLVIAKGGIDYATRYPAAVQRKAAWQHDLAQVFRQVDFIAVPTLKRLPPRFPFWGSNILFEMQIFNAQNTIGINFAGNPALAIPIPMPVEENKKTFPYTSLQLIGKPLSEAALVNAGRLVAGSPQ